MSDARQYYDSLIGQGYPPHEALPYTQQYFPDFQNIESVFDAPNVAPPTPIVEQQYVQQPEQFFQQPVMVMPHTSPGSKTILYVVGGISIAVVGLVLLAGLLYVWASDLATQENDDNQTIAGTWYNPVQTFTFSSDGDMEDNATTFVEWRVEGNNLYFVDSTDPEYEYYFRYSMSNNVLFLAPLDYDLVTVVGEDCSAYTRDIAGRGLDEYADLVVRAEWPDWCNPEE